MENVDPLGPARWSARQVVVATTLVVLVALGLWVVYSLRAVVTVIFVGAVLGTAVRPAVDWLRQRGIPVLPGVLLVYVSLIVLFGGFLLLAAPLVIEQARQIARDLPAYYVDIRENLGGSPLGIVRLFANQLPSLPSLEALPGAPTEGAFDRVALFFRYLGLFAQSTLSVAAAFLVGLFWTLESPRALQHFVLWLPSDRREAVRSLVADTETMIAGYVRAQALLMLFIGGSSVVVYVILGLPQALVLGVFAGVMEVIPVIGPPLGAVPAILVAFSLGPLRAAIVIVATIVIQALQNYVLVPRVMRGSVGVNPVVSLVALLAFAALFGVPGAILAIPLAAILQMLLNRALNSRESVEDAGTGRDRASVLRFEARELAQDARKLLMAREDTQTTAEPGDEIEDTVEAIAADLDRVIGAGAEVSP
ncbi:MAG: AI-2E family transporter [Anaerolineae bacterium]